MAYEISSAASDYLNFCSERVGGLERCIRELTSVRDEILMLDDDLPSEVIDPDGLADRLLETLYDAKSKALDAYLTAKAEEGR